MYYKIYVHILKRRTNTSACTVRGIHLCALLPLCTAVCFTCSVQSFTTVSSRLKGIPPFSKMTLWKSFRMNDAPVIKEFNYNFKTKMNSYRSNGIKMKEDGRYDIVSVNKASVVTLLYLSNERQLRFVNFNSSVYSNRIQE